MGKNIKNIAISGDIGTGKSTLAKALAARLGWKYLSAGEFFRKWHKENNIPLGEKSLVPDEVDKEVDLGFLEKMKKEKGRVFESRLAGWLAKELGDVFKILCVTDFKVAMERVAKRDGISIDEASDFSIKREAENKEKYVKLYEANDYLDPKYFDMVIDTGKLDQEQVLEKVLQKLKDVPV